MTATPNFDDHGDQTPDHDRTPSEAVREGSDHLAGATGEVPAAEAAGEDLAAAAQRFLAMIDEIQTAEAFGDEVSLQRAPRLIVGGLASLCADAMEQGDTEVAAAEHIESLQPSKHDIDDVSLKEADLDSIAEVRSAIAQMLRSEADIPTVDDIESHTNTAVDEVIGRIGPRLNNPSGSIDRDLLLVSTYREQLFHLVILHLLSEENLGPAAAAE